jgi:hypothetical protein
MTGRLLVGTLLLAVGIASVPACSAGEDGGSGSTPATGGGGVCAPGEQISCACPGGGSGVQVCNAEGTGFGACDCGGTGAGGGSSGPCGDEFCDQNDENCRSCPADCGQCAPCDIAPMCPDQGAMMPPASMEHKPSLDVTHMVQMTPEQMRAQLAEQVSESTDAMRVIAAALDERQSDEHPLVTEVRDILAQFPAEREMIRKELAVAGMHSPALYRSLHPPPAGRVATPAQPMADEFPGGTIECGAPLLRVGIEKMYVHNAQDVVPEEDEIYCLTQAESQNGGEIRITPVMTGLGDDDEWVLSLSEGLFWGQVAQQTPGDAIVITYNCIEDDSDGQQHAQLVDAIGNGATQVGGAVGGDYGWVFTTVGAIAGVVSTAMATNSDDKLFNAQQTIPLDIQLELTNGGYWSVHRDGDDWLGSWHWELYIYAWGCAEFGLL